MTNTEIKYAAVTTCNGMNDFCSPFCNTQKEVESWMNENNVKYADAIMPFTNHFELKNRYGYLQ